MNALSTHELTRTYLRLLVKRIVVNDDVAEIELRTDGAAALMAQGSSSSRPTELTCPEAVLTSVTGWLPNCATSKNFTATVVIDWETARKRLRPQAAPRAEESASERAQRWLWELESGEVESRAAIARREGLSRARVTQILLNRRHADKCNRRC